MITLGGSNTENFSRSVKVRRATNKTLCVLDDQGKPVEDVNEIVRVCEEYYKHIYSPENLMYIDFI